MKDVSDEHPLPLGEGRVRVSRFDQTRDPHPALSQRERVDLPRFNLFTSM